VILPDAPIERKQLYDELRQQCSASRIERFTLYQALRNYYLFGSGDDGGAPYNKIGSTVDTLCSFIYSPDTLRFSLQLGTTASVDEIHKAVPLAREVTDQWRMSKTHILFGMGLRWSCVFGSMMMKLLWRDNRVRSYLVEPHQFGVYREDIINLADQEAFTHHYTMARTELESRLQGNPRKASILQQVGRSRSDSMPAMAGGLSRLLIGSAVGGVSGSVALSGGRSSPEGGMTSGTSYDYAPRVEAELIDMCDLYVWDDEQRDYQVITCAAPDIIIFDRPSNWMGHVQGVAPFIQIRPEFNLYDYFWGSSFVARLTWLQEWRTERALQIRKLENKQADPPWTIVGGVGITEEKLATLRNAGGMVPFPTPNAKAQAHPPEIPADLHTSLNTIDAMFDDQAGLGHVLQGKGEPGVRSRGQADLMARLGSARPKERAIAAEESAEEAASLILRTVQEHSDQRFSCHLPAEGGKPKELTFIAEQFTKDYEVKVDAHSSSPIFVEDRKHDAITLLEAHAIDRETLLDLFDPPNLQDLKERLKIIETKEAEARQAELQMQHSQGGKRK
jgi:hypothetical protein